MAMVQLRAERAHALQRGGCTIEGPDKGLDIRIRAGVLKQVLDHALALGRHVEVTVCTKGQPPLPTLQLAVPQAFMEPFGASPAALVELQWMLLAILCRRCGIRLERDVQARQVVLRLVFVPAT